MKKTLTAGLAALVLTIAGQQPAHAWSKYNFGIGMNIDYQGGGNSVLWGLFKGAQVPDPSMYGGVVAGGPVDGTAHPPVGHPAGPMSSPIMPGPSMPYTPMPAAPTPEKLNTPPTPVKPANYSQVQPYSYPYAYPYAYQQPQAAEHACPSYWYDR